MRTVTLVLLAVSGIAAAPGSEGGRVALPAHNLLLEARLSGNLAAFGKGLRGAPDHLVYDVEARRFASPSRWHEYGVGLRRDLGVVPEGRAAHWSAEWDAPVRANRIVLSGVYPNQPQPRTAWKIEVRRDGAWHTLARGAGGWYDRGRFVWGGRDAEPIAFDAMRVSVFSPDARTPIASIHFRGEEGLSWVVGLMAPIDARIRTPRGSIRAGRPAAFRGEPIAGGIRSWRWSFGDGGDAAGRDVTHTFAEPGIYEVTVTASDGRYADDGLAIVRAHTPETVGVPQVVLDTDQKNEQDDQHYLGYALFSELDVLAVDSVHHGGGQEPINYAEILHVIALAEESGLPPHRRPLVFRGANERLAVPESGRWEDTRPIATAASRGILAAARGASPANPVWVVPVGPGTNVASAILQARAEGLPLADRLRVMWLGGPSDGITGEFNGDNDPWSMVVVARSGVPTWIMPAPVGARVRIDKRTEGDLYADHPLGRYLKRIVPARRKALYDPSCLAAIIGLRLDLGWVRAVEGVEVGGPAENYRFARSDAPGAVRVIRGIDQEAMKADIFATMKGRPMRLIGAPPGR